MPEVTEQTHAAKAVKTGIKPLLETEWSQEAPFNQLCSYSNGTSISPAVTGCVATAMSQIMYFHKMARKEHGIVQLRLLDRRKRQRSTATQGKQLC